MIGAVFSLMFMMVNLCIQLLVWSFRLGFLFIKLMVELVEAFASHHARRR